MLVKFTTSGEQPTVTSEVKDGITWPKNSPFKKNNIRINNLTGNGIVSKVRIVHQLINTKTFHFFVNYSTVFLISIKPNTFTTIIG